MRVTVKRLASSIAVCLGVAVGCSEQKTTVWMPQSLTLSNVTVVDTRTGALAPDMAIVVEHGKIVRVAPAASVSANASSAPIDGGGRFVVPGYNDMHAHALQSDPQRSLTLMLSHGITGFRQMAGTPDLLERRKRGEPWSDADAPELLAMSGLPLVPPIAGSPEATIAEIREQHALGADFIKVASLERDEFLAALAEAQRVGAPLVGHLAPTVSAGEAASGGMRAIEHLGPGISLLVSCSSDEAALRQAIERAPSPGLPKLPAFLVKLALPLLNRFIEKLVTNPILMSDSEQFATMRRLVESYSAEKCAQLAEQLARGGVWQVPTFIRIQTMKSGGDPAHQDDPNLRFVPPATREFWGDVAEQVREEVSPADLETLERLFVLQLGLVKQLDRAGVKMLAGDDMGGAQWIVPGIGLHQEFDLLESAGIAPLRVLQMTTLDGAVFLGREASMGTVEAGRNADLVLLDANPLASVQNLHGIHAVIRDGRYYSRADLDVLNETSARH
jgi:hypothetical protein